MKKLLLFMPVLALVWACNDSGTSSGGSFELKTFADSASYAQGVLMGQQIKDFQVSDADALLLNSAGLKAGFDQGVTGEEGLIPEAELQGIMMKFQMGIQEVAQAKSKVESAANEQIGAAFLAENATKEGVKVTDSGLQYKVINEGTGATPVATDEVEVNYEGRLIDGTVFDSSYKRGKTVTFGVGGVIRGWTEALQLMKEGAKYQLYIPAQLAYGTQGSPPDIKPGMTLIFDVELVKVNPNSK